MSSARVARLLTGWLVLALTSSVLAGCAFGDGTPAVADRGPDWSATRVRAVSELDVHAGVVAFTSLTPRHRLRTVALDQTTGRRLWSEPATMAKRPTQLGVAPPAVVRSSKQVLVVAIEPRQGGRRLLTARDARTGELRWTVPVHTSYGPQRCGAYICISDDQYLYMRSPSSGEIQWHAKGPAAVAASFPNSVVLFRWGTPPALQKRDTASGAVLWKMPIHRVLGSGVDTEGGWSFSEVGQLLVGHVGPYRENRKDPLSAFGFFALRLSDGALMWRRLRTLAVHPSPEPAGLLLAQRVTAQAQYGGFIVIDPRTGQLTARLPADAVPEGEAQVALSTDTEALGFFRPGRSGRAYLLDSGTSMDPVDTHLWTYCKADPAPLRIAGPGLQGYYSINPLCPVNPRTGKKLPASDLVPPEWHTGRADGWRIWRGPRGFVHGLDAGHGDAPGMHLVS